MSKDAYIDNLNNPVVPVVPSPTPTPTPVPVPPPEPANPTPVDVWGYAVYLQASGYAARSYSKIVLSPRDVSGAVDDLKLALQTITGRVVGLAVEEQLASTVRELAAAVELKSSGLPTATSIDWLQVVGLVTRAISKLTLTPRDVAGATADFFAAIQVLGVISK